ncbi:MAG: DNA (cytosine-5-)-methyltransferase [Halobacteriovoraceae bacterium]|nr:DNA (cytosine-5-)-methyltransferase [Halobacteriovoraceae bacterium]|tara:strand:+ start:8468 stop:9715 length:1248 start_codon:yes stop_codon:yes gene_type:complete
MASPGKSSSSKKSTPESSSKKTTKKSSKKAKLNFIDVFAGAGGLSCGMEQAGMNCILGVDHDKHAMDTFALNHKNAETYCGDIRKLTKRKLEDLIGDTPVHAVVGGPPCQGFSTVGLGNPKDDRNALFLEFVRLVRLTRPYFVVMENVTGLVAKKNEDTLKSIFKKFHSLGYNLNVKVMSAHNYGVPEKRRRTIIIGTRINDEPIYPKHTHGDKEEKTPKPTVTVGDVIFDLADKKGVIHNHDEQAAAVKNKMDAKRLAKVPEGKGIRYERDELAYLPKSLHLGVDWQALPENRFRQSKYQRLDRKTAGPTIMTHRHSYFHPVENRYLTAREAAKIQSFPNDFIFSGPLSAQWRQIGNAVPPLLGKAIGRALVDLFKKAKVEDLDFKKRKRPNDHAIKYERGKAFVYKRQKEVSA